MNYFEASKRYEFGYLSISLHVSNVVNWWTNKLIISRLDWVTMGVL